MNTAKTSFVFLGLVLVGVIAVVWVVDRADESDSSRNLPSPVVAESREQESTATDNSKEDAKATSATAATVADSADYKPLDSLSANNVELVRRQIPSDTEKLRSRALAGEADAAYDLFRIHLSCTRSRSPEECRSKDVDIGEGFAMLRKSADLGYWPAQVEFLPALYAYRNGGSLPSQAEIELGLSYLESAAQAGAVDAYYRLADYSVDNFDFNSSSDNPMQIADLSRVDAYAYFLAAGAVYEGLNIRSSVVGFVNKMNGQLTPNEVAEATAVAESLLRAPSCCKVWKH